MARKGERYLHSQREKDPLVAVVKPDGTVRTLADLESEILGHIIRLAGNNMCHAARMMGIGRSTLYRKLNGQ